jgi:hypothetical protein
MTTTTELPRESVALLKTMRASLRRKLTPEDLTHTGEEGQELYDLAEAWLPSQTEAEFEWLRDLATKYVRGGELTDRQASGVLNCLYAELTRDGRGKGGGQQQRFEVDPKHPIPGGYYTVSFEGGKLWRTLRLSDWMDDKRKEGAQVRWISLLTGPDNTSDYTTAALQRSDGSIMYMRDFQEDSVLRTAIATVLVPDAVGPRESAREAYAEQSGRCANCNRQLTVPASLHRGLGPECAIKLGLTASDDDEEEEDLPEADMGYDYRDAGDFEPPF